LKKLTRPLPALAYCAWLLSACAPEPGSRPPGDLSLLAQVVASFEQARPGYDLQFPRDHGSHPGYRIEWWYLTANLEDASGQPYGAQWTLFRISMQPHDGGGEFPSGNPWLDGQVYMAHAAVTWPLGHAGFQRYARGGEHGGIAQAGVVASPFSAWLDDWSLSSTAEGWLPLQATFREGDTGFSLRLDSGMPPVLQGEQGFSQKHADGGGSYYYSQPFLRSDGSLTIAGQDLAVSGIAWLDHEWSSQFLQAGQAGWDWFALHLDSGEKLMLFQIRPESEVSGGAAFRHGVLISPDGAKLPLDETRIALDALAYTDLHGNRVPSRWRIGLPEIGRELRIEPIVDDQWMNVDFAYWEGAVRVTGPNAGSRGRGYLEMTGYGPGAP